MVPRLGATAAPVSPEVDEPDVEDPEEPEAPEEPEDPEDPEDPEEPEVEVGLEYPEESVAVAHGGAPVPLSPPNQPYCLLLMSTVSMIVRAVRADPAKAPDLRSASLIPSPSPITNMTNEN